MKIFLKSLFIAACLVLLVLGWGWQSMHSYLRAPLTITQDYVVEISPGATLRSVTRGLVADGVSKNVHWLLLDARLHGTAAKIKAGRYTLKADMTPEQMLQLFIAGKVDLASITFIEGWTVAQALTVIGEHEAITQTLPPTLLLADTPTPWLSESGQTFLIDLFATPHSSVEGLLFPDTYRFAHGTSDVDILKQAHATMQKQLQRVWDARGDYAGPLKTPYEVLILASIIERESGRSDERERVAGVFTRRLQKGMRLQTDPTVIYSMGAAYDGNIRRTDLNARTAFNTYQINGLPPTPIALPGAASLQATLMPDDSDALYFVATGDGDGAHYFSATMEEHQQAVQRYLKKYRSTQGKGK